MTITAPGVYDDLAPELYHAHPALSSSGARKLLPPSCPAKFHYERSNPFEPTPEMQFGTVTHTLLLGHGAELAVLDHKTWNSKAAQEAQEKAISEGKLPVKRADWLEAKAMVAAVKNHPIAGRLFTGGKPEQSLFWVDVETSVQLRARLDYLKTDGPRPIIVDLKTAQSAEPYEFGRSIDKYDYNRQGAWYVDGVRALGLGDRPGYTLVIVEKTPPYVVTVAQFDELTLEAGRFYNRRAIRKFAECSASGVWPGYADDIATVSLPGWALNRYFEESGQ